MKRDEKGMGLIIAIMVAMIVTILLAGTISLTRNDTDVTWSNIHKTKTFYAAEAGLNYGLKWMVNLSSDKFKNGTSSFSDNFIY